jgi:hypothetical protein
MCCFTLIFAIAFPRIVLAVLFFFTHYLERAYHGFVIPLLGFIFLPVTTLAYAWMVNNGQAIEGLNALILIAAVVIDVGGVGGGAYKRGRQ